MSLDCGKLDNPERTQAKMGRQSHRKAGGLKPKTTLLWSNRANHYTTYTKPFYVYLFIKK